MSTKPPSIQFCSECRAEYTNLVWPRVCPNPKCGHTRWRNPIPVIVVLVPIFTGGLMTVRRAETEIGKLALPGGYIDFESWQHAAARELWEETGIDLRDEPEENMKLYDVRSATTSHNVLIFAKTRLILTGELERWPFIPNKECSERVIIRTPEPLAFPTHNEMMTHYFEHENMDLPRT